MSTDGTTYDNNVCKFFPGVRPAVCNILCCRPVVSLLRISGVIGKVRGSSGVSFEEYESLINKAFRVSGCKAVILVVNSPGGAPAQAEMISDQIIRLSEERKIPVYAFAEDVAASAGYYIMAAGEELYANKSSLVGSIGVLYAGFGFTEAIKNLGVERRTYYEGKNKMILDPFQPEKEDDVKTLKRMQRDVYDSFKSYVMERRRGKLRTDIEDIFSGQFWTGNMAKELGLVDDIQNYSRFIAERFGKKTKVVTIKRSQPWWVRKLAIGDILQGAKEAFALSRFGL